MNMEQLATYWNNFLENELNGREPTEADVNDFCNYHATSYEEYMAIYALLADCLVEN